MNGEELQETGGATLLLELYWTCVLSMSLWYHSLGSAGRGGPPPPAGAARAVLALAAVLARPVENPWIAAALIPPDPSP
jgi:hypothetical protein